MPCSSKRVVEILTSFSGSAKSACLQNLDTDHRRLLLFFIFFSGR